MKEAAAVEPAGPMDLLPPDVPAPPPTPVCHLTTVASPELPKRPITLVECIALALENGRTGEFFDPAGGGNKTSVKGLGPQLNPSAASDSMRVFAYDPAILATDIEQSLARFDVYSETNLFWNRIDQATRFLEPETPFEQLTTRNKADLVTFDTGLYRRLPDGGFAGLRLRSDYENDYLTPNSQIINPVYRSAVELVFEQPLLQGAGVLINQLRDTHPDTIRRQPFPDGGKPPGIMLVRIGERQSQLEFERQVQTLLYRVEEAYWLLYCAYWDLYASDNGLKQAHEAWQIAKNRYDAGGLAIEDLAMIEEQYHFFRGLRLQALGSGQPGRPGVLEAERQLRYVLGLPPEDGTRLTPADALSFLEYDPDPDASLAEASRMRPELRQVDEEIHAAQLAIIKAEDRLKPDLRFVSRYDVNGLDGSLGGAITNLVDQPHHEWELGLRMQVPLGFRAGHAETTRAKLQLAQRMAFLQDQKQKLLFSLQRSYRDLVQYRDLYSIRQSQRLAAAQQLQARHQKFAAGGDPKLPGSFIDLLLRAQRNWADAVREEYVALCNYRIAIADFERQKGTICAHDGVIIREGTTPTCAIAGASAYLRKHGPTAAPEPIIPVSQSTKPLDLPPAPPKLPTQGSASPTPAENPPAVLGEPASFRSAVRPPERKLPDHLPPPEVVAPASPEPTLSEGFMPPAVPVPSGPAAAGLGLPAEGPVGIDR
jgi:outer membrane protein TolC